RLAQELIRPPASTASRVAWAVGIAWPCVVITDAEPVARKVQRKLSNGVAGFAAGGSSSDRKRSRPIRAFSATPPHDGQRPCRTLAEDPGRTQPRAAYPQRRSSNANSLQSLDASASIP